MRTLRVGLAARQADWPFLRLRNFHYNPRVRVRFPSILKIVLCAGACALFVGTFLAQQAPPASAARILLMPRKLVTGERSTLAVLDLNGRLTPGVNVILSSGDKVTTDVTGRAAFVPPLGPGTLTGSIEGRPGRIASAVLPSSEVSSANEVVSLAPHVASVADRFELVGQGFCGDADANRVTIGGYSAVVLASSPAYLAIAPPAELGPGPAQVQVNCGRKAASPLTILFVSLELEADTAPLAAGENRPVTVRVRGTTAKVTLEARNLDPEVADLTGGVSVRAVSAGGADNVAHFELLGKKHGSYTISIRLVTPLSAPRA
jgi:hypothetical protein